MKDVDATLEQRVCDAVSAWYESKRNKRGNVNTNVMCVGIAVTELLKAQFPLTDEVIRSDGESQVRGISGSAVSRVLKAHGELREFTSEGGRTSRGSLPMAQELAGIINRALPQDVEDGTREAIAGALQAYFVQRIRPGLLREAAAEGRARPRKAHIDGGCRHP